MQGISNIIASVKKLILLILFFYPHFSVSQQNLYDNDLLTPAFHKERRAVLRNALPPNSCAVLFSNPVRIRTNDVDYQYVQDPDFYYLSGLNEPHSVLLIFKDSIVHSGIKTNELLYVQDRDRNSERWNGIRLGKEGAMKLGFNEVFINREFRDSPPDFSPFDKVLIKFPADIKETTGGKTTLNVLVARLRSALETAGKEALSGALPKILATMREIKLKEEIALMQKAIDITNEGLAEAIKAIKPGMNEYQAQAIVEYYFKHRGSEYPGYGSISGSGANSCVLHYITNRKKLEADDLLLMDMGAEYHGYTADVTRTVPADGTFSQEQKLIYELVLLAQEKAIEKVGPGTNFYDAHKTAQGVISEGLVGLDIIKDASEVTYYFNHGTSHYLGMEVHDPGNYGTLYPGAVITVEPGIYIPENSPCDSKWWNIGVRIEDDVLVTETGNRVMSSSLPKKTADIEALMKQTSLFDQIK